VGEKRVALHETILPQKSQKVNKKVIKSENIFRALGLNGDPRRPLALSP